MFGLFTKPSKPSPQESARAAHEVAARDLELAKLQVRRARLPGGTDLEVEVAQHNVVLAQQAAAATEAAYRKAVGLPTVTFIENGVKIPSSEFIRS